MVDRPDRPGGLEFRSQSHDPSVNGSSFSLGDLPSPRAGEIPPALSPLDALALQGRLLARRFEQENKAGRRMSRLAPLTIQNEFGNRGGYFASMSNSSGNSPSDELPPPVTSPALMQQSPRELTSADRHKSFYPQFGADEPQHDFLPYRPRMTPIEESRSVSAQPVAPRQGYFDLPRSHSPEPVIGVQEATPVSPNVPRTNSGPFPSRQQKSQPSGDSLSATPKGGLVPPKSPSLRDRSRDRSPMAPSIRSVRADSYDEPESSMGGSYDSLQQRTLSPSSSISRAQSPFTPMSAASIPRSPSQSSDISVSQLPRPSFNFSRPRSSSHRPSLDTRPALEPVRRATDDSAFSRPSLDNFPPRQDSYDTPVPPYASESVHTPVSMTSEDFRRSIDLSNNGVQSYTYSKFNLPRGRQLDRRSIGIEDFLNSQITWDQPARKQGARPPSPESPPRSFDSQKRPPMSYSRTASSERVAPSLTSSNSTIRARSDGTAEVSAQEHCDKGIALHEAGELTKSTYHLRLAARAGLPEAQFWYGLACRHGWGMRENKAEALQWLRKAVDSGQLEVADDEDQSKHGQAPDLAKRKLHRAQYAVAIYELGKCYMNGWGTSQDKSLALRCYEIAGNWGDADALVEAGYCYAEGVGCKKDMKKAAKFYRTAEAKGVSMVGNSWIYKEKYMDDNSTVSDSRSVRSGRSVKKDTSDKKSRDKSRTRTIFSRKKSMAT